MTSESEKKRACHSIHRQEPGQVDDDPIRAQKAPKPRVTRRAALVHQLFVRSDPSCTSTDREEMTFFSDDGLPEKGEPLKRGMGKRSSHFQNPGRFGPGRQAQTSRRQFRRSRGKKTGGLRLSRRQRRGRKATFAHSGPAQQVTDLAKLGMELEMRSTFGR